MLAVISHYGCRTILPNNNCDITLVNLIFILVISSKTTSYINLIFQSGWVDNLATFMAFVSIKAHNLHIKNFRSLRPVWCLINANQKSWEKFHRLSVCVVMLCFTYSRVQLQQLGKIVTMMQFALRFLHITTLGEYLNRGSSWYLYLCADYWFLFDFRHNLLSKMMAFTAYTFFRDKTMPIEIV